MFGFEVNTNQVNVSRKHIEAMLTANPDVKKALQDLIREEIAKARGRLKEDIKAALPGSKMESYRSVRRQVYKSVLGGDLNINNMKRGTASWRWVQKTRKIDLNPHQRGGNRRRRTQRSAQIEGYEGKARGFILRFVNDGTKQRFIGGRNNARNYYDMVRKGTGNRGQITPRNFFYPNAEREIQVAATAIASMIDKELEKVYNKNKI